MDPYRYEFFPGFNLWYMVALATLVVAYLIGRWSLKINIRTLRTFQQFRGGYFSPYGHLAAFATGALAGFESHAGVLQVLRNVIGGEAAGAGWVKFVLVPAVIVAGTLIFRLLIACAFLLGQNGKRRWLRTLKKMLVAQRDQVYVVVEYK